MEVLIRKRSTIKRKLTVFRKFVDKIQNLFDDPQQGVSQVQSLQLQAHLDSAGSYLVDYEKLHFEIIEISQDLEGEEEQFEHFHNEYLEAISIAKVLIANLTGNFLQNTTIIRPNSPDQHSNTHSSVRLGNSSFIKLPTINLPKFNGEIGNWVEFREIFNSLIHENAEISNVEKLHYLKAGLSGEASDVIKSLEFTSANYQVAWEALCERFNNPRMLVHNHLESILNMEPVFKESAPKLRKINDSLFKHVAALKSLATDAELLDAFIIHTVSKKFDSTTSREWESLRNTLGTQLPTLSQFKDFLKNTANLLESLAPTKTQSEKPKGHSKSFFSGNSVCALCNQSHPLYRCSDFLKLSVQARISKAKELKVCLNCLTKGHFVPQCHSRFTCRGCQSKHHNLLHMDVASSAPRAVQVSSSESSMAAPANQAISAFSSTTTLVLLPTATAQIIDSAGGLHTIRLLLDSGSQSNFIRSSLCKKLNLPLQNTNVNVSGLTKATSHINTKCDVEIHAHHSSFKTRLSCLVLDEITGSIPGVHVRRNNFRIPDNIRLSDPTFGNPGDVDLLIGASAFFDLLCVGQVRLGPNLPTLQKTRFGWVVSGPIGFPSGMTVKCHLSCLDDISDALSRFWELECYPTGKVYSEEENACDAHFIQNTHRDSSGRFIVTIPFRDSVSLLGDSFQVAQKRFLSLERKFQSNPDLRIRYSAFMKEYEDLGHMTVSSPYPSEVSYYLPHHGVLKEESLTTKLRVVFDGSMPTTSGHSLNSIQMVGPTIQQDLFSILLRFRQHRYAISADIEKMYRQVLVKPDQRPLQRILWRSSPADSLKSYDLNTVTYGTASASFLAIRSLFQMGIDCESSAPEVSTIIKRDFYVDDLLTGSHDLLQAQQLCIALSSVLKSGCFILRKWISNDPKVLKYVPESDLHPSVLEFGSHENTRTLGLIWSTQLDHLMYSISKPSVDKFTKRAMLSDISQIFDPLGLLSPCTLGAKALLQELWMEKISWDDPLPPRIQTAWNSYRKALFDLNDLRIPRYVLLNEPTGVELHGFSDASLRGYGACIYFLCRDSDNKIQVSLLCAKSKVAPLKPITIPKLELCGALLLSKLVVQVEKAIDLRISRYFLWTDSSIVLGWLRTIPNRLATFVCNRVAEIQQLTPHCTWRHVPTKSNPADLLSRGISPQNLKSSTVWWYGPSFLKEHQSCWPCADFSAIKLPEIKKEAQCLISSEIPSFSVSDFSKLSRLKRIVAYCLRFLKNCRASKEDRFLETLTPLELQTSLIVLIRISQGESFPEELKQLKKGETIGRSSILRLTPFLDTDGILRVGGRLHHSHFSYGKKHPILLSGKHHLSRLIVIDEHLKLLHAGPQLLLSSLRENFWITSGRNLVRGVVHDCIKCFRCSPRLTKPIMGNLPSSRVVPSPPFHITGIDYAGPFTIKDRKGRGCKTSKSYLCLFICFTTKCVHLELVTDLSTETFLLAFRRFVSRRGKPLEVYSDNGTNFVGANSELFALGRFLKSNSSKIAEGVANDGVNWHFIPAHSPHFGGLWEAGIKSSKYHLKRVIGNAILTFEELCTLLVQVEATLNSRPISPLSSDPNDLQPLSPAHFLIGRPLTSLPDPDVTHIKDSRLTVFQRIQQFHQNLWKRWSLEYISELQQRTKWRSNHSDLQMDTLVLIKEENQPPLHWKLGRIVATHPGSDGISRVASVRTLNGVVRRSFAKLCPLPLENCAPVQ